MHKAVIEEDLLLDFQYMIFDLMLKDNIDDKTIAAKMNISEEKFRNFFSANSNLTIRRVANILHAMGYFLEKDKKFNQFVLKKIEEK